ncbi:MAG: ABC transporter ATP-binding protein [Oscillochloridaceae bacterium umkhey_bin13]
MSLIVETQGLTHTYAGTLALNQLNLQIPQGAIYGFIGPNGAGKTTTMRILTTLLRPTAGEAFVAGHSVLRERDAVRRAVGFMPDFFGVYEQMTASEYLEFFAAAFAIAPNRRPQLIADLLSLVDLSHKAEAEVMGLSRGMKQRLSLARTMLHDPALLILDEPASGLDPRARVELRELLKELRSMGKTIMISSHILTELAEMCTQIGIIEHGNLLASGDVDTILRSLQPHRSYELRLLPNDDHDLAATLNAAAALVAGAPHVLSVRAMTEADPPHLLLDLDGDDRVASGLLTQLVAAGFAITHFAGQVSDLEEIFLRVTTGVSGETG